jgi:hypothetical protein
MPRPERPVDPSAGPVQQFAAELRKLRGEAGSLPYRTMALLAHVSRASLSAAASGHRLPTWEVTRAYVRACDGDEREWHDRWLAVRAEISPPPPPAPPPRSRRRAVVAAATGAAAVVAFVSTWGLTRGPVTPARPAGNPAATRSAGVLVLGSVPSSVSSVPIARFPSGGGREPLGDNADPKKTGCADNPATIEELDRVQINTLNENLLGDAVLRHAPQCHASWGRFEPSARLTYLRGPVRVTITAHRPADGTLGTPYSTVFDGQPVFGNILLDTKGCVEITVRVEAPAGDGQATTDCLR